MQPFLPDEFADTHRQRLQEEFERCGFAGHGWSWTRREARKVERRTRRDARRAARVRPSC